MTWRIVVDGTVVYEDGSDAQGKRDTRTLVPQLEALLGRQVDWYDGDVLVDHDFELGVAGARFESLVDVEPEFPVTVRNLKVTRGDPDLHEYFADADRTRGVGSTRKVAPGRYELSYQGTTREFESWRKADLTCLAEVICGALAGAEREPSPSRVADPADGAAEPASAAPRAPRTETDDAGLFSDDPAERIAAAAAYTVFPDGGEPVAKNRAEWADALRGRDPSAGAVWPTGLADVCTESDWPHHAFGTANASILVLWHRPGQGPRNPVDLEDHWIHPRTPILGGLPHLQVEGWGPRRVPDNRSFRLLRRYLAEGLAGLGLERPLAAVMVMSVNPELGPTGESDHEANVRGLRPDGPVDFVVATCHPVLVMACGSPVQDAIRATGWKPRHGELVQAKHPMVWDPFGSNREEHGERVIVPLLRDWLRG